jgi:predicted esterase
MSSLVVPARAAFSLFLAVSVGCGSSQQQSSNAAQPSAGTSAAADAGGTTALPSAGAPAAGSGGSAGAPAAPVAGRAGAAAQAGTGGATPPVPSDAGAAGSAADAAAEPASADASGAADAGAGDGEVPASGERKPDPKFLVAATGPCPEFRAGYVTFAPDGVSRRVLLYVSEAAMTLDGPLIISWHSTLPNPEDATSWLGRSVISEIEALGGIVAAPESGTPRETRPWDNTPGGAKGTDNDQRLMDEIVACAIAKVGIDVRRIHATGMSAGGLKTAQVSLRRSGYLASVVVYSGGLTDGDMPPDQDPTNLFAAMILYGGASDISPVDGIPYTAASRDYLDLLKAGGRFAFLCDHGGGHSVPRDSQASAWKFFQDHPFGTTPSPYAAGLPSGFLRYCSL